MKKLFLILAFFLATMMIACGDSSTSSENEIKKDTMPSATNSEGQPATDTAALNDSGGVVK